MTPEQARQLITEVLAEIAPDADPAALAPDADLRTELELDSLDFLNFVEELGERAGRRIEEDDYSRIATLAAAAQFLSSRLPARSRPACPLPSCNWIGPVRLDAVFWCAAAAM